MAFLKWNPEKESWICSGCGAEYHKPKGWRPPCGWCMQCKASWLYFDLGEEN